MDRKHEMGAGGTCVCAKCGKRVPHERGERCIEKRCPECGAALLREGSEHHQKAEKKHSR